MSIFLWWVVCRRKQTEKNIREILKYGGKRNRVKLKNKEGKIFEARIMLEKEGKFSLEF